MGKRAAGFSLLELLVAMAVGAILLALLNSVLASVQSGWRRTGISAAAANEQLSATQFLDMALAGAFANDPLNQNAHFLGMADGIEFTTAPLQAMASHGPVRVKLYLRAQENGGKALVAEMKDSVGPQMSLEQRTTQEFVLLAGLDSISIAYFDTDGNTTRQMSTWSDPERLPKIVSMTLSFVQKNTKPMRLAISPRQTFSGRCKFDMVSLSCRI